MEREFCFSYLTKEVLRVQLQASPGFKIAAAGFSSHLMEPPSALGRLCQGSMQTNLGIPGLDQIKTYVIAREHSEAIVNRYDCRWQSFYRLSDRGNLIKIP